MVTGLLGSLVPYIEFLAPRTWRASRQLERLRLEGAPVPPGGLAPANGFQMVSSGDHVVCAVTGETIPLDELRYWSVARQEPYASAEISVRAALSAR